MKDLIFAFLVAFFICVATGPFVIPLLQKLKFGQNVRDDGPKNHLSKQGTPTMGGIVFIIALLATMLFFAKGNLEFSIMSCIITVGFGFVGFLDDFIKVKQKRSMGLRAYQKIIGQFGLATVVAIWAKMNPLIGSEVIIPWANKTVDLGIFYVPFVVFVFVATVNAVNLTDGLDGLASGIMFIDSIAYIIIFLVLSNAQLLLGNVAYGENLRNMSVFSAAAAGACLGFLRFNSYPAKVFMGDTGSLAMGGIICSMAIFSKSLLLLPFVGVMYVASAVSVILQVGSYKLRNKKRIFLMAPLHHHFELKGFPETKIVTMYMIITTVACLLALVAFV